MTTPNCLITVLIPVYNAEKHIGDTLDSLLTQTSTNFEVVCVDDGSTDESLKVLKSYKQKFKNFKVISRKNTGIVSALNDGIAESSGEFIARLDSDDICKHDRLEKQAQFLVQNDDVIVVGSSAELIDEKNRKIGFFPVKDSHEQLLEELLKGNSVIHHPSAMIRKSALLKVNGYREGYCPAEDYDLWLRLSEVGKLANITEPLIIKRQTTTGLVATRIHDRDQIVEQSLNEALNRRGLSTSKLKFSLGFTSTYDIYEQWTWLAIKHSNLSTARHYALKAAINKPFKKSNINMLYCAFIKRAQ